MRRDASSVNPPHARPEVRWCLELPRITQKDNALGRLGNDQDVRQGHLGSFIDEKDVDDLSGIGACPEPRGSCCDVAGSAYRLQQNVVVSRELKPRHIIFLLGNLLDALDGHGDFFGGSDDLI